MWEAEAMGHEIKISLNYIVRPCLRKQKIPFKNLNGPEIYFLLLIWKDLPRGRSRTHHLPTILLV